MKITIALPDHLYDTVKHWAVVDGTSINSWMAVSIGPGDGADDAGLGAHG